MNNANYTSVTIQKYPEIRVLPLDHPCVCNLSPVYIDKINGNPKISTTFEETPIQGKSSSEDTTVEVDERLKNGTINPDNTETKSHDSTRSVISDQELTLGELLDLDYSKIPFLVEKLIPAGTLVILGGQSEIGKSTLYSQLSIAIVFGDEEFLGCKIHPVHRKVLIISSEDGPPAVSFRFLKQIQGRIVDSKIRNSIVVKFNYDNLENRIHEILQSTPVDLIIIDAFGDVFGDGINVSNDVRRFFSRYSDINNKYNCATLFVHHVGKSNKKNTPEKDKLLGSVGIEGKMRNVIMLSKLDGRHQLNIVKGNYVSSEDKSEPIYLNFNDKTLTFSVSTDPYFTITYPVDGEEDSFANVPTSTIKEKPGRKRDTSLYNQAIKLYNEGKQQIEIAETVGRDKSTICKWIKEYNQNKGFDLVKYVDVVD